MEAQGSARQRGTVERLRRAAKRLLAPVRRLRHMEPGAAFDLWAATYDGQVTNPLLLLDDELTGRLLSGASLAGKVVVDVGCGSGRHWPALLAQRPARLVGYDASDGMLACLRAKYPGAELHRVTDHRLRETPDASCDLVISTLTFGYIADAEGALREWARVLRPGGEVVLTDLHPDVATPESRSFKSSDRTVFIRHQARSLRLITEAAGRAGLVVTRAEDGRVGDAVKRAYEAANALALYQRQEGTALMFGMRFGKAPTLETILPTAPLTPGAAATPASSSSRPTRPPPGAAARARSGS